jgi:hypothetical protein
MADRQQPLLYAGGAKTARGTAGLEQRMKMSRFYASLDDRQMLAAKAAPLASFDAQMPVRSMDDLQEVSMEEDLAELRPELTLQDEEYEDLTIDAAAAAAAELATEVADELKNAMVDGLDILRSFSDSMSQTAVLRGDSLGVLAPTHPVRVALHRFIEHPAVETFLLLLIVFNLVALAATSPGSEIDLTVISADLNTSAVATGAEQSDFDETMYNFNVFCACAFTCEAVIRILVLGLIQGPGTYMRSAWNAFDLFLVIMIWLSITASALLNLDDDAGFALSVLRTLRLMRFFSGIRELMTAVAVGYKMLLTIMGLLLYAWIIGGVVGMELFAGVVSRTCLDPASPDAVGLAITDCPRTIRCELPLQCYQAAPPDITALHAVQIRDNHRDKIGYDTIGAAFVTEFQVTIMDDWPELVQPIAESGTNTAVLARPVTIVFVCLVSMLSVNLFLASITHSYLTVRQDSRGQGDAKKGKSLQEQLAELEKDALAGDGDDAPRYSFPMHRKCTPTCKDIASSSKFETFMVQVIILNVIVLMMDSYDSEQWVSNVATYGEVVFVCIYTVELLIKVFATGFRPYLRSHLNKLDFIIVAIGWASLSVWMFGSEEDFKRMAGYRLLRVLRVAKLLFHVEYLRELLELAFSSAKTVMSLVVFLFFTVTLLAIVGMHMFASRCHAGNILPSSSFGSFGRSVLTIFQIVSNDNVGGIMYYYMDCYENTAAVVAYFGFVIVFVNYVVINLFMAVFIENFELSEEMKARKQEDRAKSKAAAIALGSRGMGEEDIEPTKLVQLKALQVSLFLDRNTKKHVFQRLSKFSEVTVTALKPSVSNLRAMALMLQGELRVLQEAGGMEAVPPSIRALLSELDACQAAEESTRHANEALIEQLQLGSVGEARDALLLEAEEAADDHAAAEDALISAQKELVAAADEIEETTGIALPVSLSNFNLANVTKAVTGNVKNITSAVTDSLVDPRVAMQEAARTAAESARQAQLRAVEAATQAAQLTGNAAKIAEAKALEAAEQMVAARKEAQAQLEKAAQAAQSLAEEATGVVKTRVEEVGDGNFANTGAGLVSGYDATLAAVGDVRSMASTQVENLFEVDEKTLMEQNKDASCCCSMSDTSIGLFGADSEIRRSCERWVAFEKDLLPGSKKHSLIISFERVMLFFVLISAIAIALEGPPGYQHQHDIAWVGVALKVVDGLCFVAFFVEFALKVIACGFILTPTAYLLSKWNWLDGAVVMFSIVDVVSKLLGLESSISSTCRLLRILRPLRLLRLIDGMHVVLEAISAVIPVVLGIALCILLAFTTFGIVGVAFYGGRLYRCHEDLSLGKEDCIAADFTWANSDYSFDNIFAAYQSLFFVWTGDDWGRIVHACMDAPERIGEPPSRGAGLDSSLYLYWISFLVTSVFMLKGLFVACLVDMFAQSSGSALATKSQKQWTMLKLVLRNIKPVAEAPTKRYLCFPVGCRRGAHRMSESFAWNVLINVSIILTTAILLLPTQLWPAKIAEWFELINTGILLLWTLEFMVKTVAYGLKRYFLMAKTDCLVIPFLYAADAHAMINVFAPAEVAQHFDFLSFVAGFQFLRVLRCTRLLARVSRLRSLFATVELSLAQARNILIILTLVIFIYGVVGMKLFGNVCSPDDPLLDASACEVINIRGTFRSILGSMAILFEITTNEDASPLMRDLNDNGSVSQPVVSLFFGSFYMLSNFILLNLLVAAIVENYELGVAADQFDMTEADVYDLRSQWDAAGHSLKRGIHIRALRGFIEHLEGRFARLGEIDPLWYNRLLIELQSETQAPIDHDSTRIPFNQLVLALCLMWFGPQCLGAKNSSFLEPFYTTQTIILPRQARHNHRENHLKKRRFSQSSRSVSSYTTGSTSSGSSSPQRCCALRCGAGSPTGTHPHSTPTRRPGGARGISARGVLSYCTRTNWSSNTRSRRTLMWRCVSHCVAVHPITRLMPAACCIAPLCG